MKTRRRHCGRRPQWARTRRTRGQKSDGAQDKKLTLDTRSGRGWGSAPVDRAAGNPRLAGDDPCLDPQVVGELRWQPRGVGYYSCRELFGRRAAEGTTQVSSVHARIGQSARSITAKNSSARAGRVPTIDVPVRLTAHSWAPVLIPVPSASRTTRRARHAADGRARIPCLVARANCRPQRGAFRGDAGRWPLRYEHPG
jgi:hypothetical protein